VKRHFLTMKRVARGLKLACMLLFAIVAYAAFLKRGKSGARLFQISVAIGTGVGVSFLLGCHLSVQAKSVTSAKSGAAQGPPKQIFTRSNRSESSNLLGVQGQAAYIASSVGTRSGILITDVTSEGTAARFGINVGDVLLTLNQRVVTTARDADRILQDTASGNVKVSFAHPSDAGLQLYNTSFAFTGSGTVARSSSGGFSRSSAGGGQGTNLSSQIPNAESQMLGVINQDRSREKAAAITSSGALASLARAHAQDMAAKKFFNHVNKEGLNPQDRANRAGVGPIFENISFATGVSDLFSAAQDAERQMMGEPPNQKNHRSNIIDPDHKTVGVGIAVSKDGVFYMVQEFSNGSP
jgi:uncharacterized protein YkwD